MVMIIPTRYPVSEVIGKIKCQTVSNLRKKFSWLSKVYWKENIVLSPGYFVSIIGLDEKSILEYVKWQTQDLSQAKLELFQSTAGILWVGFYYFFNESGEIKVTGIFSPFAFVALS